MAKIKATANKVERRVDVVDLKSLNVRSFDFDNKYPQRVGDIVNDSGTAKTCLRLHKKYVTGSGLSDDSIIDIEVNSKKLTVGKFYKKIVESIGKYDGVAIHFNYNGLGKKTEINFIPFEYCRLTMSEGDYKDMVAVHDDWDNRKHKKFDKNKIDYIHKYDPDKVLEQVESCEGETIEEKWSNYKGQVLYWTPNGSDEYPLAPFDAVLEDMITEAQTKRFKNNTSAKNFLASHIIVTNKEEADGDDDEFEHTDNGTAIGEAMTQFQGGDGAGTMLHIERENDDEVIDIKKIELQNYDRLFEYTEDSSTLDIIRQFLIPPTLLLQTPGSLGTGKEIEEAKEYYNEITQYDRDIVTEILEICFEGFDAVNSDDFSIKPIATMLANSLGIDNVKLILEIVNNPSLDLEQKKGTIQVLFGLNDDDIDKMLTVTTLAQ